MLHSSQIEEFQTRGHLTVPGMLDTRSVEKALEDIQAWSDEFLAKISEQQKAWYFEHTSRDQPVLRKLDNPVFHRDVFRELAARPAVAAAVEQLIGPGVSVFFSQVFCKPPEVGGPKPVHQDNFYFGPDNLDATLTVWIALDEATVDNGCLFYGDGSHRGPVLPHSAPESEPFNLQIPAELIEPGSLTAAPVPSGGISFHHGNTLHQSSSNTSIRPRRAVALHYLRNDARLVNPALPYDGTMNVRIT